MSDAVLFPFFDTAAQAMLFAAACLGLLLVAPGCSRALGAAGRRLGWRSAGERRQSAVEAKPHY